MLFVVSPRYWYRILSWSEKRDRAGLAGWIGFGFLLHCGKVSLLLIDGEVSIGIAWPHQSVDYLIVDSNTHTHHSMNVLTSTWLMTGNCMLSC